MGAIERRERSLTDTLVCLVNPLGVTVDYLLADSVANTDFHIMDRLKQIVDGQLLERKQMAVNILRTIFAYFENGGEYGLYGPDMLPPRRPRTNSTSPINRSTARSANFSTGREYSAASSWSLS